jgi:hypothetical protein
VRSDDSQTAGIRYGSTELEIPSISWPLID